MIFSMRLRPLAVTCAMVLPFLAACSSIDINATRAMKSVGSEFQQSLHFQYAELAFAEDKEGDAEDAVHFNEKAMAAARGEAVLPQAISERKIPAHALKDLTAARARLSDALGSRGASLDPKNMARAQAMFDCWLQEQEEDNQPDDVKACRTGYETAMGFVEKEIKAAMAKPAPAPMKMADLPKPLTVYFGFDSFEVDDASMAAIKSAVKAALDAKVTKVIVTGHADRAGSDAYNDGLSRARATAVGNALMIAGIPRPAVEKAASGEMKPDVKTADGKKEPLNRRVVVTFQR